MFVCVRERGEELVSLVRRCFQYKRSGIGISFHKKRKKGSRRARVSLGALKSLRIKSITATRVVEVLAQRVASSVKVWILKYCPLLLWIYECGLIMEYACR